MESPWQRSVKRKMDQIVAAGAAAAAAGGGEVAAPARVEVENEVTALREALVRQQQTIQDLSLELEEERNAASSAASEAMSMILRLQREKAEVQMEFRQFKRFAEEKMAHDQQELVALDDLLFKREQTIQSLACEIRAYKHRLLSYGVDAGDISDIEPQTPQNVNFPPQGMNGCELPEYDYPPLRCMIPGENDGFDEAESSVVEKYTPTTTVQLQNLENRIYETEANNRAELGPNPGLVKELEKELNDAEEQEEEEEEESLRGGGHPSEDDESARVYTIDAVHAVPSAALSDEEEDVNTVGGKGFDKIENMEDGEIKKLYMRLQVLEADRESMRQAIMSMRTEKAQFVLLKEIAQQLYKEAAPPERRIVKKPSLVARFSFASLIKWVLSFIFWRKAASRSKYQFGPSSRNAGLLLLLDKSSQINQWRCLAMSRK